MGIINLNGGVMELGIVLQELSEGIRGYETDEFIVD